MKCRFIIGGKDDLDLDEIERLAGFEPTRIWRRNKNVKIYGVDSLSSVEWIYEEDFSDAHDPNQAMLSFLRKWADPWNEISARCSSPSVSACISLSVCSEDPEVVINLDTSVTRLLGTFGCPLNVELTVKEVQQGE